MEEKYCEEIWLLPAGLELPAGAASPHISLEAAQDAIVINSPNCAILSLRLPASQRARERRLQLPPVPLPSSDRGHGDRVLLRRGLRPQRRLQLSHLPEWGVEFRHAGQLPPEPR